MNPEPDDEALELLARRLDAYCRQDSTSRVSHGLAAEEEALPGTLQPRWERVRALADEIDSLGSALRERERVHESSLVGQSFGRYEVLSIQGIGGFGVVYRAFDPVVRRDVALKIPRVESLLRADARRRFLQEAQAAARLDHPHIAAVLESGESDGVPFIVSTYCPGQTLAQWMKSHPEGIDPREAIDVVLPLAEAMDHAHGRGVLHRDIKPSNILMLQPSGSGRTGAMTPKITDFGLAKLAESTLDQTHTGALIGTVRYMAPEQAAGRVREISTASDIYSLGMIFYELLTGKTAFEAETDVATLTRTQIDDAIPPGRLKPGISRDIEAICLKCLEKNPRERYRSASALAEDLRLARRGEPTIARPLTRWEQLVRWVRKKPAVAAFAVVTLLSIVTTSIGSAWYSYRLAGSLAATKAALGRAERSELRSEQLLYAADMKLAGEALARHDTGQVRNLLDRHIPAEGQVDMRNFIWHCLERAIHEEPVETVELGSNVYCQDLSADGRHLVTGDESGSIRWFDVEPFVPRAAIDSGQQEVNCVALDTSGERIASAGKDGTVKIWKRGESDPTRTLAACPHGEAFGVEFVGSGEVLVTGGDDPAIRFWNATSGELLKEIVGEHADWVESIDASPDGTKIVVVDSTANILVFDTTTFERVCRFRSDLIERASVARYSPDGQRIAVIGSGQGVLLLDGLGSPDSYLKVSAHRKEALAWNGDGSKLFVGERSGAIRVFSVPKFTPLMTNTPESPRPLNHPARVPKLIENWQAHSGRIWSLAYVDTTGQLISTSAHRDLARWELNSLSHWKAMPIRDNDLAIKSCQFSRDGKTAIGTNWFQLTRVDPQTLQVTQALNRDYSPKTSCALDFSGIRVAFAKWDVGSENDAEIVIHRTDDLSELAGRELPGFHGSMQAAFSSDGKYLGVSLHTGLNQFQLWDADTLETLQHVSFANLRMSLGSSLRVAGENCFLVQDQNEIVALRCHDLGVVWRCEAHRFGVACATASLDGSTLYTIGGDGLVKSWDLATCELQQVFSGDHVGANQMALSPDGQVLVTHCLHDTQIVLWDCRTQQQVASVKTPGSAAPLLSTTFTPDGRRLLICCEENQAFVLDTR
jgi:serine/threonine protein kinase/WD40 repeat protein